MRLAKPGGFRSVVAEPVLIRHQLLILSRGRKRAPNLHGCDRLIGGLCTLFIGRTRILRSAIVLKPSTLLSLHRLLTKRKYRLLFSPRRPRRPGPKGPGRELVDAVVEVEESGLGLSSNLSPDLSRGVVVDKDVVRRILSVHYRPAPGNHWRRRASVTSVPESAPAWIFSAQHRPICWCEPCLPRALRRAWLPWT